MLTAEAWLDRVANPVLHVFTHIHIIIRLWTPVILIVIVLHLLGHVWLDFVFVLIRRG